MRVDEVMTRTVVTIRDEASIPEAIAKLVDHRISGLPVLNALGRLVGMVTEGDLLRRIELGTQRQPPKWLGFLRRTEKTALDYVHDHTRRVADLMTRHPVSVEESTSLETVVALMEQRGFRRIPVVSKGGLVGIISRSDLVRILGQVMQGATLRRPDSALRDDLIAELTRQPWFKACRVTVDVQDGAVRLKGTVSDATAEKALRAASESLPGVVSVRLAIAIGPAP